MARLRILAAAAVYHPSDANTCTEGQVCWTGVGKETVCVGIEAPTVTVMSRLILSTLMVTVDQTLAVRA